MLTRSKIKRGEGSLEEFNPKIGTRRRFPREVMEREGEERIHESEREF